MSVSLVMAPLAVGVLISGTSTGLSVLQYLHDKNNEKSLQTHSFETEFADLITLRSALIDCGADVKVLAKDSIVAKCCGGTIMYKMDQVQNRIKMYLISVDNEEELLMDIEDLKDTYGMNVQDFTYNRIKEKLPKGMRLEEERVLEDDTIQLVLVIDE